ncbi:site-specific integrase [Thalassobaculum sp.]|uniref:site-specific integrase n=1 Tax=Thalassobaculum sp. TaxID=2022740 RepID=UPI0032EFD984
MPQAKITKRFVDSAKAEGGTAFFWDTELRGFGLKVTVAGRKIYVAQYRVVGHDRQAVRMTIGTHGKITPEDARKAAKRYLGQAEEGVDPAEAKRAARKDITVSELCDLYLNEGVSTKSATTVLRDRSRIERHIKPLVGKKRLGLLDRGDVERMQSDIAAGKTRQDEKTGIKRGRSIVRGGEGAARETVVLLSAILGFAVNRRLRADNPALGVKKYRAHKRERFLSPKELAALGTALSAYETDGGSRFGTAAVRLLILTGARKSEILGLRWSWVDWERSCLRLPESKTGERVIRLGAAALLELQEIQTRLWDKMSPWVIQGRAVTAEPDGNEGEARAFVGLQKVWERVRELAALHDVRLHDLRHSFASVGASGGDSLHIIGKLLGHNQAHTTQRYAHLADDPVNAAADRISGNIAASMNRHATR